VIVKRQNLNVFVYGTLLEGFHGHATFLTDKKPLYTGSISAAVYHLPFGYPVAVECSSHTAFGEIYEVDGDTMTSLREYEGVTDVNPIYKERMLDVTTENGPVKALVFTVNPSKERAVRLMGTLVEDGRWGEFIKSHKQSRLGNTLKCVAAAAIISLSL
jgi:gamma-glutamylcyclotransferase (GGCT)/AIG2-like uncharacterized protein YtfP